MEKGKGKSYPNPKGHTGPRTQLPQARRPLANAPRGAPRAKGNPKGR
jgi:hypothetical protein